MHKADVADQHHRFDLEMTVAQDQDEQRLRRGYDATDRVHRQLLARAVDRRGENLQCGAVLRPYGSSLRPLALRSASTSSL